MALPASFAKDGFLPLSSLKKKYKHLLIGTEGQSDTGKSEFGMSAPGPTIYICLDRMLDGALDNPNPPAARREDIAIKMVPILLDGTGTQASYLANWKEFYDIYTRALANPDVRTVVLDGDSDSWELQRLAEFGKLQQVPALKYVGPNAARRAMYARAFDSGKIVIATNKVKDMYKDDTDSAGKPKLGKDGNTVRVKSGEQESQGFGDQDYLWHIRLRHLYRPASVDLAGNIQEQEWGIRILKCKANTALIGDELWGSDCCFETLVRYVYPHIPISEWGY
ncbi:MAG: hypothetical protein ACREJN_07105 [Nitrospiraceae bacterium]